MPRSTRSVPPSGRGKKPSGVRYSSGLLAVSSACPHRRRPQRNHGGESRKGRPKARHCVRRVRHRVAARPVLPVLFRFVPGLGPELVLLGPHSLQVHRLDIFRVHAAERLDLMDDLIRHPAPGLVTQPVPDPPAGYGHEHRERHEQISGHRSSKAPESRKLRVARRPCMQHVALDAGRHPATSQEGDPCRMQAGRAISPPLTAARVRCRPLPSAPRPRRRRPDGSRPGSNA